MKFSGRTAIVTGAASGIGREIAQKFAANGASLLLADIHEVQAEAVAEEVRNAGGSAVAVQVDVSSPEDAVRLAETAEKEFGGIDILVHSAGIGVERNFLETTIDEWRRILDVDLSGTFLTCQACARSMAKKGYGRIVNLASTAGIVGGTGRAAYGAAKGGVIALTKVMSVELAPFGITVNALAPGAVETELVKKMHSPETRTVYRSRIPLDRYGTPEEVAAAALFLAGEDAGYVTGVVLAVDGGFLAAGVMKRSA